MKLLVAVNFMNRDVELSRQTLTEMASIPRAVEMAIESLLPSAQENITKVEVRVSGNELLRTEPLGEYV